MITVEIVRSVPLFSSLPKAALEEIADAAADIHLVAGEWLVEGELPAFFTLLSGEIEVARFMAGAERVIGHYHPGDSFGEARLLLGSAVIANLRATTDSRVLKLAAIEFHNLMARSEQLTATILRMISSRFRDLQRISVEASVEIAQIIGRSLDVECYDLRDFLSRNNLDFRWLDPDDPAAAELIPESARAGPYPAVVLPDGSLLTRPSTREVAERLGFQTAPQESAYDVVIAGGGPAGLAAAVYGASEGLRTLMVEREAPGGQAGTSSRIENYLGFPAGLSGTELSARALQQAMRFGTEILIARQVTAIHPNAGTHEVMLDGGDSVQARAIVLAFGVAWRTLSVPGADKLVGRGIYYGTARSEAPRVRRKDVYLVGGGNSAGQAALFFASYARRVTLLVRGSSLQEDMSQYLIDQLAWRENIAVQLDTTVIAVHGEDQLEAITVRHAAPKRTERLETDSLFVFIGADARTSWLPDHIARDERGYILTGMDVPASGMWSLEREPFLLETSVPGIFAAGDVRHRSIKRVASSVGEGSMSIAMIHRYRGLATQHLAPVTAVGH
ncbi:MAG: cyclic nucleotide-binding protein [Chloroflexi bacterium]|nr:cyclic nucleotide-binding protein [Chloroflexota bacterium]